MSKIKALIKSKSIPIKDIVIENNLAPTIDQLLCNIGHKNKNILLVSSQDISNIADKFQKNIANNNIKNLIIKNPKADLKHVKIIENNCNNIDLILAIGSGTINDLCKISSFYQNIPYIICASAPSMNGYASANASISVNGFKKSLRAHLPQAIYCDLDIVSQSPTRMIQSGIGDSLCYWSCNFDWLLSNLILGTKFKQEAFDILESYQNNLLNWPNSDLHDPKLIELLCQILIISGISMYLCSGSYPASQSEHLISHFLEMQHPKKMQNIFHGEQIAVTTLTTMKMQQIFLDQDKIFLKDYQNNKKNLANIFKNKPNIAIESIKETEKKIQKTKKLELTQINLKEIQKKLLITTIKKSKLLKIYDKFDLKRNFSDINVSNNDYQEALNYSHLIRDRFTIIDFILPY